MAKSFSVLTLNCWGVPVPFACKKRSKRMPAIGDALAKSSYDIVALQEVWHKKDFEILREKISRTMPFFHYYYSGTIGSGLCIFSKWPILQTLYHRFDPNGYPHKIQHGDWFGGKGVGMAIIQAHNALINVYVTHLHAEYARENDEYLAHRVAQSFCMSQFIKFTSTNADLTLLCGDLNLEPVDLGYKMICTNSGLQDAWLNKRATNTADVDGNTSGCPTNSFSKGPKGLKRIDYILYKEGKDVNVVIEECSVAMGTIPGTTMNFSDHEAVEAVISVRETESKAEEQSEGNLESLLLTSLDIITKGLTATKTNAKFFTLFAVASLFAAYFISVVHIPYPIHFFVTFIQLVLVLAMGFGMVHTFITIRCEVHGLETVRQDLKNLLSYVQQSPSSQHSGSSTGPNGDS